VGAADIVHTPGLAPPILPPWERVGLDDVPELLTCLGMGLLLTLFSFSPLEFNESDETDETDGETVR
jgi:hypothetical protein